MVARSLPSVPKTNVHAKTKVHANVPAKTAAGFDPSDSDDDPMDEDPKFQSTLDQDVYQVYFKTVQNAKKDFAISRRNQMKLAQKKN